MGMKKRIVIPLSMLILLGAIFCFVPISFPPLNKIVLYALEKRFDTQIKCSSISLKLFSSLDVKGVKIRGKDGLTILINDGVFNYNPIALAVGKLEIDCMLQDVTVIGEASLLDLITDLLAMEPIKNLRFQSINGTFFVGRNETVVQNLVGISELVKFNIDGATNKDNSVNLRVHLLLNDSLIASIPSEMQSILLKKEKGPWSSMSIGITGNYKEPRLRLLTDLFQLDITTRNP